MCNPTQKKYKAGMLEVEALCIRTSYFFKYSKIQLTSIGKFSIRDTFSRYTPINYAGVNSTYYTLPESTPSKQMLSLQTVLHKYSIMVSNTPEISCDHLPTKIFKKPK